MSPGPEGSHTGPGLAFHSRRLLHHRSYHCLKKAQLLGEQKCKYSHKRAFKPLPVGFLPEVKPSLGARASICAGVTEDDDGVADWAVGVLSLLVVGACDDDGTDGHANAAG
jgi:hypothetical protein